MATSFTVNKADLTHILKQIKIAEATSIGYTATPVSILQAIMNAMNASAEVAAQLPFGLRTVDGSHNNLLVNGALMGAADTLFPRLTDPVFRVETDGDAIDFNGPAPGGVVVQGNYGQAGVVVDADPRIISNLIVDMSINNQAAIDAFLNNPLSVEYYIGKYGVDPNVDISHLTNEDLQTIPNQSPDIGLSPGFNSWMTFFGQFFDHGLDLVTKGGNETVYIPLRADDPLIAGPDGILVDNPATPVNEAADNLPPQLQFMALTRATPTLVNGVPQHENTTTSWVDQNQTYTSHPSHQVFLREYVRVDLPNDFPVGFKTIATGKVLDGAVAGTIANWAEVKAQALTMLGIQLRDIDVFNVPLLLTDEYGKFIPGANGYAQMVMKADAAHGNMPWLKEGTLAGITTDGAEMTNHAFLNDLAHHAAPGQYDSNGDHVITAADLFKTPDASPGTTDDGLASTYDNEMLDAHFITGDGRGNENIALTTVHSIFHSEHNRLVEANKATIIEAAQAGDIAFLNEWLLVDVNQVPANLATLMWDGERLFQAARFATEMQYQHMVFEEFARRIQPMVDPFIFNSSPNVDSSILAEFAHTVYRFGHSMLTGTVDRLDNNLNLLNGDLDQQTLLAVFLNPQAYLASGTDAAEINANLVRGLSRDVGNAIDEFIVTDLRSNLVGLPLDLAALNIARGRDTGIPTLNQTRAQLYNDTGLADLKPYTSWIDFASHIKNATSVINFIAAYGTHASILAATTLTAARLAAEELVFGIDGADAGSGVAFTAQDRADFLNGTGIYASTKGGLELVDLWIGGLAESPPEFGGMLGSTFNYVFEAQMENLQNGDRLYYLTRTQGMNLLNQLEPNTFADMVMRNTALGDVYSTHLNGQLFVTPDFILELDRKIAQEEYGPIDYNGADPGSDPTWAPGEPHSIFDQKVTRSYSGVTADGGHDVGGSISFKGGEHVVLGGTEGNDILMGDKGIDTLWGDGGNDYLNAGTESDDVFGGEGDDVIEDPFGDDVLRGNQGNDVVSSARGLDLMFGDQGTDYIMIGQDAGEAFGGLDNDFILGGNGKDFILGNEGDDWIEGGGGFDTISGENSDLFFNSTIIGHDVMFGQGDEQDYDAESGDDIMGSGPSVFRYEGMFGFDWGIGKYDLTGVDFDLAIPIFTTIPNDVLRDRFDQVEAASGWIYADTLNGDDRGHVAGGSGAPDLNPTTLFVEHQLTVEGIARIAGMQALLGSNPNNNAMTTLFGAGATNFRDGNILIGGGAGDIMHGRGGFDIIDGDAWLNVRIKIVHNGITYSAESMSTDTTVMGQFAGKVFNTNPDGSADFNSPAFGGVSLNALMLNRTLNPGELTIVREILDGDAGNTSVDTAKFYGTLAEYVIEGRQVAANGTVLVRAQDLNGDGFISVRDLDNGIIGATVNGVQLQSRGILTDDTDLLKNIERLLFSDQTITIAGNNDIATGTVTISDPTPFGGLVSPYVGQVLTATLSSFNDLNGIPLDSNGMPVGLTFEWQRASLQTNANGNPAWITTHTGAAYTVRIDDPGHVLRAVAVFNDSTQAIETISSATTDEVMPALFVNENSITGTVVSPSVPFTLDGINDGLIVQLTHIMVDNAGGRFQLVTVNGVQQIQVANGGPVALDYEDPTNPDHGWEIVINSYTDTLANGGILLASRQMTVLINDLIETAPTDIHWTAPAAALTTLPGDGTIGTLSTVDPDSFAPWTYSIQPGSSAGFAITSPPGVTGTVTRSGGALAVNTTYIINARSMDNGGAFLDETFKIMTGSAAADTIAALTNEDTIIYGLQGTDTLTGGNGNDTLFGQDESDTLIGGLGDDVLNGGAGDSDTASYVNATTGVNVSLLLAGQQNTLGGGLDTLIDIENLTGSNLDDTLIGNAAINVLNGLDGNDTFIYAMGSGADVVNGGIGTDAIVVNGTAGDDTLDVIVVGTALTQLEGGAISSIEGGTIDLFGGTDTLSYVGTTAANPVTVNLTTGAASGFTTVAGIETVTGGDGNDLLTGDALANTLNGGLGNDTLSSGGGTDNLNGNGGTDTALYTGAPLNYGFSLAGGNVVITDNRAGSPDGVTTLNSIELVQFAALTLELNFGTDAFNVINGGAGDDLVLGFGGADELSGGVAVDYLVGGAGLDDFNFNTGDTGVGALRDVILDFATTAAGAGDDIDVSIIDANTTVANNNSFTFIGTAAFSDADGTAVLAAGQVRYALVDTDGLGGVDSTLVQFNIDDVLTADFEVLLQNYMGGLVAADFFL